MFLVFKVPKYPELKVESVWNIVKTDSEINSYFPDYEQDQYPERDYLFAMLSTLRKDELLRLIKTAENGWACSNQSGENEMVQITNGIRNEIFNILPTKSKSLPMLTFWLQLLQAKLHSYSRKGLNWIVREPNRNNMQQTSTLLSMTAMKAKKRTRTMIYSNNNCD